MYETNICAMNEPPVICLLNPNHWKIVQWKCEVTQSMDCFGIAKIKILSIADAKRKEEGNN